MLRVLTVPRVLKVLVLKVLKVLTVLKVHRRAVGIALAAGVAFGVWIRCAPIPAGLLDGIDTPSTVVTDRHGRVLYEALSADGSRIRPLDAAGVPPVLEAATIAAEDRRFYAHPGVDPVALLRAARHNLVEGHVVEGGSTITQQVAKLLIQRREGVHHRGMAKSCARWCWRCGWSTASPRPKSWRSSESGVYVTRRRGRPSQQHLAWNPPC